MQVINIPLLEAYWKKHPDTRKALIAFLYEVQTASWKTFNDLKASYPRASLVGNNRVVFDIRGNNYRLVTRISWKEDKMLLEFIGSHAEYDKLKF